jgi:DNA-directed RNA polymerase subunit M/transcription elongation factor TFIIS
MMYAIDEDVVDGTKTAVLTCRKCEYKEPITKNQPVVYEHSLKDDTSTRMAVNPYLKYDPTLPRFKEIVCPNVDCPSRKGKTPDVVGVKVDAVNLVWMYQCANCDYTWKQASRAV